MFDINEYVIYGNNGVCRVNEITTMDSGKDAKKYYCLIPVNDKDGRIFTPVDNDKVVMRKILTKNEAMDLIDNIPTIEQMWIPDEKHREANYKEAIHTCDCRELIRIIKTMYMRREERLAKGMKSTVVDERYLREAEDNLYGELSIAIGREKSDMEAFIAERIELLEA